MNATFKRAITSALITMVLLGSITTPAIAKTVETSAAISAQGARSILNLSEVIA